MRALAGIRVLDFTRVVAGPYCTMLLSDLGAEVIKVEQPGRGDDARHWGPPFVQGESTYFLALNRNKKSVCLDLHEEQGAAIARRLVTKTDVVIESFRPGIMDRFGLGYAALREIHPALIYCSITGFGTDGPYRDRVAYDLMVTALAGLMGITGTPGGEPVKTAVPLVDIAAGLYAFSGVLAALLHKERTGEGQRLDVSLLNAQLAILLNTASQYLVGGVVPKPEGNVVPSIAPYQAFRAADGYLVICAANDKLFQKMCQAMNHPEWSEDPRFRTNSDRTAHRLELQALVESVLVTAPAAEWQQILAAAGIAVAPVNTMDRVFEDPQVIASGQVATVTHSVLGEIPIVGPAVKYSETPAEVRSAPPRLGEHTAEVLNALLDADCKDLIRWATQPRVPRQS